MFDRKGTDYALVGAASLLMALPTVETDKEEIYEARGNYGKLAYIEDVPAKEMPDDFEHSPSHYAEDGEDAEQPGNVVKIQTKYDGVPVTIKFWDVYGADGLNTEQPYSETDGGDDKLEAVEIEAFRGMVETTLSVDDRGEPVDLVGDRLSSEETEQLYQLFSDYYHDIRNGASAEMRTGDEYEPDFREMIREVKRITR